MRRSNGENGGSTKTFIASVSLIQVLGIIAIVLTGIWMGKYRGGFAWDGSGQQFNYHPVCMVIGLVYLYSEAMIVYRVFRNETKYTVKLVHFALQLVAFFVAVFGLKAAFDFHNKQGFPNMYSLHSWLGLCTVLLFTFQLVGGFVSFLYPKLPDAPRASYLKVHVFFGVFVFVLAVTTCLTGMTEKALFSIPKTYSKFVPEGVLINTLGIVLILLAAITVFVVTNKDFQREEPTAEQVALIQNSDEK
ncbi:predicted protein [Nematostella vectensis]|uniref:Cytochrome b561 domain-containing protein n=1 Tax=Nematostella vectensis TaxID=45351 RepID=A7RY72_NEMVE|nr:transmembrane ascorbate-dependent reductase CYB561 [Nematostella vectensis]EDO43587.1 predicted protein [Nematostella vectensis]|eukprot:XP_001635650.1 predicted protein [Nematostella vectensis]